MTYDEQHAALVADLKGKLERGDWHGVSDAANDLRVIEAENGSYETLRRTAPRGRCLNRLCEFPENHVGSCWSRM